MQFPYKTTPPRGREWENSQTANAGGGRTNPGIRILPLPRVNGLLGGRMSGCISRRRIHRMENYSSRPMTHKLTNGMQMWKGNGNTITLLFSLKGLEILHQ